MEKKVVNNYGSFDTVFVKGKGATLWDKDGKKFIDFIAGIGCNALGHNYKPLVKAVKAPTLETAARKPTRRPLNLRASTAGLTAAKKGESSTH